MRDQLRGSVRINASGRDIYGFINDLHGARICCLGQYVKGSTFTAVVRRGDLKTVGELCERHGLELRSFEYDTLSSGILRRKTRFGLILGAVLVIAAFLYFSSVVVTIEVQGNQRVSSQVIMSALEELGIRRGIPFRQIDYVCAENRLRLMVGDLAWAGMHRTGHRLVVEVMETVEKPEMVSRVPCNIVAARDGVVGYTSVLDGMLMHKVGDTVRAGDVLISGVTSDDTGHVTLHHAMGSIGGSFTDTAEFRCPLTRQCTKPVGRTECRRVLELFSLDIPLYFGRDSHGDCRREVTVEPLVVLGKQLPVALRTIRCTELTQREVTLTDEQARAELAEKLFLYEKNFLGGYDIIDRSIDERSEDGELVFGVKWLLQGELGTPAEVLMKAES